MAFEEIIEKVKKTASEKAEGLNMKISDRAINTIIEDLKEHRDMISEGLVKRAAKEYDVYESTEKLIKEASTYAIAEERKKYSQQILKQL